MGEHPNPKPKPAPTYYKCFECNLPFQKMLGDPCECGSTKFYRITPEEFLKLLKEKQP
jgi:hypothetical protein